MVRGRRLQKLNTPLYISLIVTTIVFSANYWQHVSSKKEIRQASLASQALVLAQRLDQVFADINFALIHQLEDPLLCSEDQRALSRQYLNKLPMVVEFRFSDFNNRWLCDSWGFYSSPIQHISAITNTKHHFLGPEIIPPHLSPMFRLSRKNQRGEEVSAIFHRTWLDNQIKYFHSTFGYLSLINSDSGIPILIKGHYSLPIQKTPVTPLNVPLNFEGRLDNGRSQFIYAEPLLTQPGISVIVSEENDVLYEGIYEIGFLWYGSAFGLFSILFLSASQLQKHATDPVRQLSLANSRHEFFNVYQPIVSSKDFSIQGVEVLMRWQHPMKGVMLPNTFIPIAEQSGLICELTRNQLTEMVKDLAPIVRRDPTFEVAVNICYSHLMDPKSIGALIRTREQIPGLVVEITENQMLAPDNFPLISALERIHNAGIKISIDDFGTGYCALSYLSQLPVDVLKADKSFIAALGKNSINSDILETILKLAHNLGIQALAEGVEQPEQARALTEMGFDLQQGWYHSYPLTIDRLLQKVERPEQFTLTQPKPWKM